jgi:uncharacterized protein (TIGR02001 family)
MEYALFRGGVAFAVLAGAFASALPPRVAAQWHASGNIGLVSDYVYRGYSRSAGEPASQASVQASNGRLTLGAWASQVELLPRQTSTELDAFVHWQMPLSDSSDAGLTATYYSFPGDPRSISYDYAELSASLDWRQRLRFELAWSPRITLFSPYYGPLDGYDSWSAELTALQPLRWGLVAFAGIGHFDAPQLRNAAYTYGSAGLSRDFGRWHAELSYFHTAKGVNRTYTLGTPGGPLVATLAWHF